MTKADLARTFKQVQKSVSKHSPEILTSIGVLGMLTTTGLAVKATPKALVLLDEARKEKGVDKLTPVETVKATWKCYLPAAVTCAASVVCIIGANSVTAKRTAALTAAYKISETALAEYREKVVETIGEKKEKVVREKISQKHVDENPVKSNEVIITGRGTSLFLDPISKRHFESDIEHINKVVNMLNKRMLHDIFGSVSLSDFYDEIGLERTDISDDLGWNIEKGMIEIDVQPAMTSDKRPCLALYYALPPKWGYA
jgi:hypothetical protein